MSGFLCSMVGATFTVAAAAEVLRSKKGITAVGNAQVSTAQSQFGGASATFDGTGDALLIDHQGSMRFGTGNFSMEFWYRPTSRTTNYPVIFSNRNGFSSGNIVFHDRHASNTSKLTVWIYNLNSGAPIFTTTTTTVNGTWYHIALTRSGTSLKLFVNGTQEGSTYTTSANIDTGAGSDLYYLSFPGSDSEYNGFIDEVRVSNTARYTANFTPSTTAFVNDANTLLLIHANGTNASTFFEDDNGVRAQRGITAVGNAQIDTAQSKFGGSSYLGDGTGDYLTVDNLAITGDFTYECFVRFNALPASGSFMMLAAGDGNRYFGLLNNSGTYRWESSVMTGSNQYVARYTPTITTGVWYHIALVKSGSTLTLYHNGTVQTATTIAGSMDSSSTLFNSSSNNLGAYSNGNFSVNGWLDEVRISTSARYTAGFTPSTTPFVNDANTLLLIHADGTDGSTVFRDDNGTGRTSKGITAIGNAQISTAQSKFGGASSLYDGNGDYLQLANSSDFNFTGNYTIEGWWYQPTNVAAGIYPTLIATGAVGDNKGWMISSEPTTNKIAFITSPNGSSGMSVLLYSGNLSAATWNHWAVVRSSSVLTLYINGTASGSTYTTTGNSIASTYPLYIGGGVGGLSDNNFSSSSATVVNLNGYLDEIRISNIARYTATFTPSTTPFQNDANTLLLLHMDGTNASTVFIDDNGIAPYTP